MEERRGGVGWENLPSDYRITLLNEPIKYKLQDCNKIWSIALSARRGRPLFANIEKVCLKFIASQNLRTSGSQPPFPLLGQQTATAPAADPTISSLS